MSASNPCVSFEEAELTHLREMQKWSFKERLDWNEQMTRFAIESQKRNYLNLPKDHVVRVYMESHPEEIKRLES